MSAWAAMNPRENIETRARLARGAIERARQRGDSATVAAQDKVLSRVCGEGERLAAELAGEGNQS